MRVPPPLPPTPPGNPGLGNREFQAGVLPLNPKLFLLAFPQTFCAYEIRKKPVFANANKCGFVLKRNSQSSM